MMHPVTFIAIAFALDARSGSTNNLRVQTASPDSFADIDAKLKQMEEKTKAELAKLQADTAAPSSFMEEGSPDSFADLDAKLKQLEEKTKAELAKLQADTAAPSSFMEEGSPDSFADLDAKLKQLEEKINAELAKLQADAAAPAPEERRGPPSDAEPPSRGLPMHVEIGGEVYPVTHRGDDDEPAAQPAAQETPPERRGPEGPLARPAAETAAAETAAAEVGHDPDGRK